MKLILCCLFLIIIGIVLIKMKFTSDNILFWLWLLIMLSSVTLFVALILIPIMRMQTCAEIKQFESIQRTIANTRENKQYVGAFNIENAALQQEVIEANEWLANTKYWKTTTFSLWVPDEINNLSEIK